MSIEVDIVDDDIGEDIPVTRSSSTQSVLDHAEELRAEEVNKIRITGNWRSTDYRPNQHRRAKTISEGE